MRFLVGSIQCKLLAHFCNEVFDGNSFSVNCGPIAKMKSLGGIRFNVN